jgi:predicted DNA-binding transcriptional regulator YafY
MLSSVCVQETGMRRADRLFQIIQVLRRTSRPITADAIAAELETSKRTIYRDIATLMAQRVPIRGEAGIGYVLDTGFDLPPLMLTTDEIEAAVLGAQWVAARGDASLARAAQDLTAKIAAILPERLRPFILEPAVATPPAWQQKQDTIDVAQLRRWCQQGRKIALSYRDEQGQPTERTIWPFIVGYLDASRVIIAWCEKREDFRRFRTDRIASAEFLDERYSARPETLRNRWRTIIQAERLEEMVRLANAPQE